MYAVEMSINYYRYIPPEDIKKEIHMTDGKIEAKFTYPNGFVLETVITAGEITVKPSGILIDNEDGTYTIPEKVYPNPI
jgi:antitoxin component YwqK of YwqJK toxin-antitoxin module